MSYKLDPYFFEKINLNSNCYHLYSILGPTTAGTNTTFSLLVLIPRDPVRLRLQLARLQSQTRARNDPTLNKRVGLFASGREATPNTRAV